MRSEVGVLLYTTCVFLSIQLSLLYLMTFQSFACFKMTFVSFAWYSIHCSCCLHYNLPSMILQIRRQSTYELQIFKDRWARAVKEDKNWSDPFKTRQRRRQWYKQRRKSKVKRRWGLKVIWNSINGLTKTRTNRLSSVALWHSITTSSCQIHTLQFVLKLVPIIQWLVHYLDRFSFS